MATTTTHYGFDIPQSTDLVKDGATAIATLGQDIDTAMNTALGTKKSGLVLLNTTSFSGVASQTVSNIFTSAYRNYFLTWESTSPASQYPNYRLSTGGTPNSTSNYITQRFESSGAGSSSQRTTDTVFNLQTNNTRAFVATLYIFAPQVAEKTFVITHTMHINDLTFTQPVNMYANGIFNDTTQFDGIQLLPNTSTITGTLKVYGLN